LLVVDAYLLMVRPLAVVKVPIDTNQYFPFSNFTTHVSTRQRAQLIAIDYRYGQRLSTRPW
jgi:hypothetical protein